MIQTTPAPPEIIPAEVLAFAAQQGVAAYLSSVVAMTRLLFPDGPIQLSLDQDPEIANDRHIVLEAKCMEAAATKALEARFDWHRKLFAICPAPLVCVFRLGLEIQT